MCKNFMDFLSEKKTLLFLVMCLFVHAFNCALFYYLGIFPLLILNVLSCFFYVFVIHLFKKNSDLYVIFAYFEIITFSFISDLFTGCAYFYIFYVIGMISVISYLLPPKKNLKHIFQGIGIVYAVAIYCIHLKNFCLFPEYLSVIERTRNLIGFINLGITLFTLFYISNLYIYEINSANDKLTYCSNHDLMTGLFNRRFFEHIMRRNKTENESPFTIAIFDIDDFKKVNDTYGHQAGDCVLKTVSLLIEDSASKDFIPVRWGGEEFILYMPQTDEKNAYEYLELICSKIRDNTVYYDNQEIHITVTAGMFTGEDLGEYEEAIRKADERLYYGKKHGKNCVVNFDF